VKRELFGIVVVVDAEQLPVSERAAPLDGGTSVGLYFSPQERCTTSLYLDASFIYFRSFAKSLILKNKRFKMKMISGWSSPCSQGPI